MNLIREIDHATRVETDPVKAAIAEMEEIDNPYGGPGGTPVDKFIDRFGEELRKMDRQSAGEAIGDILENDPAYQYGPDAEYFISAVLRTLGRYHKASWSPGHWGFASEPD